MQLKDFAAHPLYPFTDFATNEASFLMCELLWTAIAREALAGAPDMQIVPLMEAQPDGNPILFFRTENAPQGDRAIRVLLIDNPDGLPVPVPGQTVALPYHRPLDIWADHAARNYTAYDPKSQIDAALIYFDMAHPELIPTVIAAIQQFLVVRISVAALEEYAAEMCRQLGYADPALEAAYWDGQLGLEDEDGADDPR